MLHSCISPHDMHCAPPLRASSQSLQCSAPGPLSQQDSDIRMPAACAWSQQPLAPWAGSGPAAACMRPGSADAPVRPARPEQHAGSRKQCAGDRSIAPVAGKVWVHTAEDLLFSDMAEPLRASGPSSTLPPTLCACLRQPDAQGRADGADGGHAHAPDVPCSPSSRCDLQVRCADQAAGTVRRLGPCLEGRHA